LAGLLNLLQLFMQ